MRELIISVAIIGAVFYGIFMIMEYKAKNFTYEKHNFLLILVMILSVNLVGFILRYYYEYDVGYSMMINAVISIAFYGGYIIFQKNRIYYFKGIDKKLIKEYEHEIVQIIEDYRINYTGSKSEITFIKNRVVFEKVSKEQAEECLSLIGNLLDINRREYSLKDYLLYFIKGHIIPTVIIIAIIYLLFKLSLTVRHYKD